ncbi:MAG TPA: trypsin-like peptidase domain-containing protein [Burkholderiaceae bacterium]
MKKAPLYSRSRAHPREPEVLADAPAPRGGAPTRGARLRAALARHERRLWAGAVLLLIAGSMALHELRTPPKPPLTMQQIDAAMRQSIDDKPLPAATTRAYETILPSVVRIVGLMSDGDDGSDEAEAPNADPAPAKAASSPTISKKPTHGPYERGVGTGVVIVDNGTILTNFHVIRGAKRIRVTFMDGTESDAVVLNTQPENDLAVLRAKTIPDDLQPATLRSTADLAPGDAVLAVGFPFGIGPSASSGIVSGLKREFRSPEGAQTLTNLIQFDAAANPGNSGGPLVTMDGEVVGIVTAILNPSRQRTFIGIGFAVPIENAASAVGMPPF